MATRTQYSAKQMHGQGRSDMLQMLSEKNVTFENFPVAFREGTFLRRVLVEIPSPTEAGETYTRSKVEVIAMPPFQKVANRTEVIFESAEPIFRLE
jgi:hypothetical protein